MDIVEPELTQDQKVEQVMGNIENIISEINTAHETSDQQLDQENTGKKRRPQRQVIEYFQSRPEEKEGFLISHMRRKGYYYQKKIVLDELMQGTGEEKFVECSICYETTDQFCNMEGCCHNYCNECVKQTFVMRLKQKLKRDELYMCPEEGCKGKIDFLTILEIYKYNHIMDNFLSWNKMSKNRPPSKNNYKVLICQSADCTRVFLYHKNQKSDILCKKCMVNYDPKTQERKIKYSGEDIQQMANLRLEGMMRCPACQHWVQRSTGCNHMTCTCRFEFCYECGKNIRRGHYYCGVNVDPTQGMVIKAVEALVKGLDDTDEKKQAFLRRKQMFENNKKSYDQQRAGGRVFNW